MNMDVVWEILLHLSVQSLLRCRGVCKLWRDVIDSSSFRKLHTTTRHNDNEDDTVDLVLEFVGDDDDLKLLMDMVNLKRDERSSLKHDFNDAMPNSRAKHVKPLLNFSIAKWELEYDILWFDMAVRGLICFNFTKYEQPISVCNPFLGQMRTLPIPQNPCLSFTYLNSRRAAIGFDDDSGYYKVVQMSYCRKHHGLHARLYSTRTDSWRDLDDGNGVVLDRDIVILKPIISLPCNNGYFVHWKAASYEVVGGKWESIILTFDMKKEVFRSITVPIIEKFDTRIIAKDEYSFDLIATARNANGDVGVVGVYESSMCEGNGKLRWNVVQLHHKEEGVGVAGPPRDYVVLKIPSLGGEVHRYLYYYRAGKISTRAFQMPSNSEILAYKGTFISP